MAPLYESEVMYQDVLDWVAGLNIYLGVSLRENDTKERIFTELLEALEVDHLLR